MTQLINWLQEQGFVDFVNAFTTVVPATFAGVQLWRLFVNRRDRVRAADSAAWIEFWRMGTIQKMWQHADLIEAAEFRLFRPNNILPPDWSGLVSTFGPLGTASSRL